MIEPEKEPRNILFPLIACAVLLLGLAGIGYVIYTVIGGPKSRVIKLSDADAKKAAASGNNNPGPVPAGPPFPPMQAIQQASDPGGTMITLDLKNATLAQAIEAISKQANVKIQTQGGGGPGFLNGVLSKRFDLAVSNQPFWTAMQELCKAAQVYPAPYFYDHNQALTLLPGASPNAGSPIVTIGSSKLLLTNITSRFNADMLSMRPPSRSLTVSMILYVDPALSPYRISPVVTIESATDENGVSLVRPPDPWADRNNGNQGNKYVRSLQGQLQFPTNAGQRIAKLKGYASIVTSGSTETVKIKDPLKVTNLDSKVDGQTVRLVRLTKQGGQSYEAAFLADATSPMFKDWDAISNFSKLLDAGGKEFNHNGSYMGGGNKTIDFGVEYAVQPGMSEPAELDITLPSQLREIRVPFEFDDLPLPH